MRLVIKTTADAREREFRYDLPASMTRLAWSPNGKRIAMRTILGGSLPGGVFGIHIIDAGTGDTLTSLRRRNPPEEDVEDQITDHAWIDEETILFASRGGLGAFDVSSGEERSVWKAPPQMVVHAMTLARDSLRAAISVSDIAAKEWFAVAVVPSSGGEHRELLRVNRPEILWTESWDINRRSVLVTRWDSSKPFTSRRSQLWTVPVDSAAKPSPLPLALPGLNEVKMHPDGRRIAFSAGAPTWESWMLSGLGK